MNTQTPFTIHRGLPAGQDRAAVVLYWQAFKGKLGKLLGPDQRGIGFFESTINPGAILAAVAPDGPLLGIAAFQVDGHGFSRAGIGSLFRHYGLGAVWRLAALVLLERTPPVDTLQMDGICVAEAARGQGVGSALLTAIFNEAHARGLSRVTLDVIDTNPGARRLYERCGFTQTGTETTGPLRRLLGFESAAKMIKVLNESPHRSPLP